MVKYWILPANKDEERVEGAFGKRRPYIWRDMRVQEQSAWSNYSWEKGKPKGSGTPQLFKEANKDDVLFGYQTEDKEIRAVATVLREPYDYPPGGKDEKRLEFEIVAKLSNPIKLTRLKELKMEPVRGTPRKLTEKQRESLLNELKNTNPDVHQLLSQIERSS